MKKAILAIIAIGALSAVYFYVNQTRPPAAVTAPITAASPVNAGVVSPVAKPVAPAMGAPHVSPLVVENKATTPATTSITQSAQPMADNSAPPSPRSELATTIPELVRLIEAQDFETLMQDFMPPEELNMLLAAASQPNQPMTLPMLANLMRQNPKVMQQMAVAAQFLTYLQTQTPAFDATGESASYPMGKVINGQNSVTFVKVGGYWYVKNGAQFFR